jgi:UDP:flavonoid glycosyltransferase YjiC (YdhE family)
VVGRIELGIRAYQAPSASLLGAVTRFLFATIPAAGHTFPALPIVAELVRRGHDVRWYAGAAYAERVESVGAHYCPMSGDDYSRAGFNGAFPERERRHGLRKLQFDMVHGFARPIRTYLRDLQALLATEPADLVVGDTGFGAGVLLTELGGPPMATFGISVVGVPSRDLPPFGFGLPPYAGALSRLRGRVLDGLARHVVFRPMTREVNAIRAQVGLPATNQSMFEYPLASALYLQLGAAGFEYPRSDLPGIVHYVGPPRPVADPDWSPPSWWPELEADRPVVLVNQGTVATDADELIRPALAALADQDLLVVAVTGGADPATVGPLPANARVERFVPFAELLPHVDAFVTNGGFGGVQLALAEGVPVVAAGTTEDKLEVNARVAHSGVGIDLRTSRPEPAAIRAAVHAVLTDPAYTLRADALAREIADAGREQRAATLLESVAGAHSDRSAVADSATP